MTKRGWWFVPILLVFASLPANLRSAAESDPYAIATFCTPQVSSDRPAVSVANGAELQAALDRAGGGETQLRPAKPPNSSRAVGHHSLGQPGV
jgi:hypothetical protein